MFVYYVVVLYVFEVTILPLYNGPIIKDNHLKSGMKSSAPFSSRSPSVVRFRESAWVTAIHVERRTRHGAFLCFLCLTGPLTLIYCTSVRNAPKPSAITGTKR